MTVEVIKDFTPQERVIRFRIRGEVFEAASDLPAMVAIELAELAEKKDEGEGIEAKKKAFADMFRLILLPESADRFVAGMSDLRKPISIRLINDIMPWLMEEYGLVPTKPPSDSSDGSGTQGAGTNSTGNALVPAVSTLDGSLSTVS